MLPYQRRLLIDAQPGHLQGRPERIGPADRVRAAHDIGEVLLVQAEGRAGLHRPGAPLQVEQHRPGGGGGVGDVRTGQAVQEPGVTGRDDPVGRDVAPEPCHLRCREVRIERQPRRAGQPLGVLRHVDTDRRRAPVLPGDGGAQGSSRGALPGQHGLSLIGEAHRRHAAARLGDRIPSGVADRFPELLGVLLDTAARHRTRRHRNLHRDEDLPLVAEDDGFGRRRPLIDREDFHRSRRHR